MCLVYDRVLSRTMPRYLYSFTKCISSPAIVKLAQVILLLNVWVPNSTLLFYLYLLTVYVAYTLHLFKQLKVSKSNCKLSLAAPTDVDDV